MQQTTYISNSEKETLEFAKKFAEKLNSNEIIILSGDLGSGKTKFTQGILSYFGLETHISSPTFTIVNEYKNENIKINHFDLYRLHDPSEFSDIGGEDYFGDGVCIIEWGELIESLLPSNYIKIEFSRDYKDDNKRVIKINFYN